MIADAPKGNTWTAGETFNAIEAEGIVSLMVFVRDSTAIHIDGKCIKGDDDRITIHNGTLTIAAVDSLPEHRIHEVRIYTPQLGSYRINHCGEANLSGETLSCEEFHLDIRDCNTFRCNAQIETYRFIGKLENMLMATLKVDTRQFELTANRIQHVELRGDSDFSNVMGDSKDKITIIQ